MNIQPTYVTFKQAKLLKEKRFNVITKAYFFKNNLYEEMTCDNDNPNDQPFISAPEQWQVIEWLKINHGIWINISAHSSSCYYAKIQICTEKAWENEVLRTKVNEVNRKLLEYNSPQKAYSAAFDYVLNHLL